MAKTNLPSTKKYILEKQIVAHILFINFLRFESLKLKTHTLQDHSKVI